jgi:hypothetical protein
MSSMAKPAPGFAVFMPMKTLPCLEGPLNSEGLQSRDERLMRTSAGARTECVRDAPAAVEFEANTLADASMRKEPWNIKSVAAPDEPSETISTAVNNPAIICYPKQKKKEIVLLAVDDTRIFC